MQWAIWWYTAARVSAAWKYRRLPACGTTAATRPGHLAPPLSPAPSLTPVDTAVMMRPIISRDRAMELIAALPQLPPQRPAERGMRFAKDFYHQLVLRCDCGELAAMIHGICHKRAWAVRHGKKVSQMDERYLKREEQLYGELAAALDMPRDQVLPFIRQTWEEVAGAAGPSRKERPRRKRQKQNNKQGRRCRPCFSVSINPRPVIFRTSDRCHWCGNP